MNIIHNVCALNGKYIKVLWAIKESPEGVSPLCAGVPVMQRGRLCLEALVSRKVANREVRTEVSETTKVWTDKQERNMRHNCLGEQAHLCEALRTPKGQICRFRRIRQKGIYLTKGGLHSYEIVSGEVSRGHSTHRNKPKMLNPSFGSLTKGEGLNVKLFQML